MQIYKYYVKYWHEKMIKNTNFNYKTINVLLVVFYVS